MKIFVFIKRFKVTVILSGIILLSICFILAFPFLLYVKCIFSGIDTSYLKMLKVPVELRVGSIFNIEKKPTDLDEYWKIIHFSNFEIPIPIYHTKIDSIPIVEDMSPSTGKNFGIDYKDKNGDTLFSFQLDRIGKIDLMLAEDKLFALPLFKHLIEEITFQKKWEDLFIKDISPQALISVGTRNMTLFELFNATLKQRYFSFVYSLYIAKQRQKLFPFNTKDFSFYFEKNLGIVSMKDIVIRNKNKVLDLKYNAEEIFIWVEGVYYVFKIQTRTDDQLAESFRSRFFEYLKFRQSQKESSVYLYNEYKVLPFAEKIQQPGFLYLYASWSHDLENKKILREMIQFLERGERNLLFLQPLYKYAYKHYQTNFSKIDERLQESAEEHLERMKKEELENDLLKAEKIKIDSHGNFSSEDAKVQYNLDNAKTNKEKLQEEEDILISE